MVNIDDFDFRKTPAINDLSSSEIASVADNLLKFDHPCHNQAIESHVKVVTEASSQVVGYERRDGLIRQKLKSRMIMKKFDTKQQFVAGPVNTDEVQPRMIYLIWFFLFTCATISKINERCQIISQ